MLSLLIVFYHYKFNSNNIFFKSLFQFKFYNALIILVTISLLYSLNFNYGINKTFNIVLNIPFLLVLQNYFGTVNFKNNMMAFSAVGAVCFFCLIIVVLIKPFDQSQPYSFELFRWSHVIFARTFSLIYFVLLIFFIHSKKKIYQWISASLILTVLIQLYISNLRTASVGVLLFTILILIYAVWKRQFNNLTTKLLLSVFTLLIIFIYFVPQSKYFSDRYLETVKIFTNEVPQNSGITTRFISYEKSIDIVKDRPIFGTGVGGFKGYKEDKFLSYLKYPHNIFLEFQVELGIFGLIFFLFYLFFISKFLYKHNVYIMLVWMYTLWLALFAKDIGSNFLVFIPLIFYGSPYESDKLKEFFAPNKNSGVLPTNSSSILE